MFISVHSQTGKPFSVFCGCSRLKYLKIELNNGQRLQIGLSVVSLPESQLLTAIDHFPPIK